MNLYHLSCGALLFTALTFSAEPASAEGKNSSPPAGKTPKTEAKPQPKRTPPGQFAKNKAKDARDRARQAKKSGDKLIAERLENTAKLWEKVASHQEKAAKLEEEAAEIERKTLNIKSQARRAHSLVEQTETRRARAIARLRELGLSEGPPSRPADSDTSKPAPVTPAEKQQTSEPKAGSK